MEIDMTTPIPVCLVYSAQARQMHEHTLHLAPGTTLGQALQGSGLLASIAASVVHTLEVGVWGKKMPLDYVLQQGDRIELYRPLTVDPKVARRERFAKQGSRGAGLFAKRRTGAKAGY
jgi:uncharacterized protein